MSDTQTRKPCPHKPGGQAMNERERFEKWHQEKYGYVPLWNESRQNYAGAGREKFEIWKAALSAATHSEKCCISMGGYACTCEAGVSAATPAPDKTFTGNALVWGTTSAADQWGAPAHERSNMANGEKLGTCDLGNGWNTMHAPLGLHVKQRDCVNWREQSGQSPDNPVRVIEAEAVRKQSSKREFIYLGCPPRREQPQEPSRPRKFRKKPVVIEAVQYFDWMRKNDCLPEGVFICWWPEPYYDDLPTIHTLEGDHIVRDGDWVITGVKGEKYPCKPDIFEATYEPED